jgi:NADH-quinone oxidoreductase subunit C
MKQQLTDFLKDKFSDSIIAVNEFRGDVTYSIKAQSLIEICQSLKTEPQFEAKYLAEISCVDWLGHELEKQGRFELIYSLYSYKHSYRFFLSIRLDGEKPKIKSLTSIWNGANWLEREVYDLFGVEFEGHPNLTKIVTPDELEGHPLRKDYPLTWEQPKFSWNKDDPPEVIK